ncbi:MAG: hypothetical protein SGI72_03740 [Planctomycetota bacterium]|nr:hypothetical protein [Planctomycetota bacterium]
MREIDAKKAAAAERTLLWSVRSAALSLAVTLAALVLAVLDIGGGDDTILAAVGLFTCFVGVFFAFIGLFGLALARETPTVRAPPSWAVPWSVGAILANFGLGLFGMLT